MHVTVFLKLTSSFKLWPDENTGPLARRIITLRSGLSIFSVSRFLRDSNIASDNEFLITSTHNIQMKYYVKKGLKSKPISVYTELFSKQLAFCNVSYEWDFFTTETFFLWHLTLMSKTHIIQVIRDAHESFLCTAEAVLAKRFYWPLQVAVRFTCW